MSNSKHRKRRSDYSSSETSEAGSVEERPSKKASRSRKRRHSSSDDESDSASSTTSEETRSSTSTSSSSSSSEPRRKRKRHSHHHKRSHKHRDSKGKRREKRKHKRRGDVRRRHKKGEKDTSGRRPVAVEMPIAPQVASVEKRHTCGPPFPYAPSAGLRVLKQEFIEQYIQPAVEERMKKTREKKLTASATAARPKAIQLCVISSEQEKSSASGGESVSEYLCREFNVRVDDLGSVFHSQLDKVKELLIGKRVQGDPAHYPRGGVSFVVDDVTKAPPERLSAYHTPGPGPYTVAAHFQRRGIKLKHSATWPCIVHRGGRVSSKRKADRGKNHVSYYPIEVLQFDVAGKEEGANDEDVMGV